MGDDDMFSSDLSEDQLRQRLGHMSTTQCQVCNVRLHEAPPVVVLLFFGCVVQDSSKLLDN